MVERRICPDVPLCGSRDPRQTFGLVVQLARTPHLQCGGLPRPKSFTKLKYFLKLGASRFRDKNLKILKTFSDLGRESEVRPAPFGPVVQLVRMPHLQCGGQRFESARVQKVRGKNPLESKSLSGQCRNLDKKLSWY